MKPVRGQRRKKKMKNQTTEELAKDCLQIIVKASEAGNHEEVLSLVNELGKASQGALIAVRNLQDENGERPFVQAMLAVVNSGVIEEHEAMRQQNEILDAKRRLHSLGYDEFFDEVHGFTRWEHTRTGHRPMDSDPRKVLKSLKSTEEN
jgi:hypothetical protein